MCLVLLALDAVPDYPVLLAANRDERHDRPADPLHWWPERPDIAGGRDARAGGTWLAAHAGGRFAAVLNDARLATPSGAPSRGELVPTFLTADEPGEAVDTIMRRARAYAGFHFLGGAPGRGWYCHSGATGATRLTPGVHAIDNTGLDAAGPRLARARELFQEALARVPGPERLLGLLGDDRDPGRGAGDDRPVFVRGAAFGTRCSTVLRIAADGRAELLERRFDAAGTPRGERRLEWAFSLAAE